MLTIRYMRRIAIITVALVAVIVLAVVAAFSHPPAGWNNIKVTFNGLTNTPAANIARWSITNSGPATVTLTRYHMRYFNEVTNANSTWTTNVSIANSVSLPTLAPGSVTSFETPLANQVTSYTTEFEFVSSSWKTDLSQYLMRKHAAWRRFLPRSIRLVPTRFVSVQFAPSESPAGAAPLSPTAAH